MNKMMTVPKGKLTIQVIRTVCMRADITISTLMSTLWWVARDSNLGYKDVGLYQFPDGGMIISKYLNASQEQFIRDAIKDIQEQTVDKVECTYDVHAECKKANVSMNDLITAMHELAANKGLTIREVGLYEYKSGTRILNNISETCANYIRAAVHMIRTPATLKLANQYPQLHKA